MVRSDNFLSSMQVNTHTRGGGEGIIRFNLDFTQGPAPKHPGLTELESWRRILFRLGLIGCIPERYEGLAYGNVSLRTVERQFLVSGSQTGGADCLYPQQYCHVLEFDLERNYLRAQGQLLPSSESLAHGALYAVHAAIGCAIHIHSPEIWQAAMADRIKLPVTPPSCTNGTPEMAVAIQTAAQEFPDLAICMGGHQDGIIAYGKSPRDAGQQLLVLLAEALSRCI